jgi:hypothetical protein
LDRFPETRRARLAGLSASTARSRQTPVNMTIWATIPAGTAEAPCGRAPPLAGLKAMSSPTGFFSGHYSRQSSQGTQSFSGIETAAPSVPGYETIETTSAAIKYFT